MHQPFIFLAFANSEKRYLKNLEKEKKGITDVLLDLYIRGVVDFLHRGSTTSDDMFKVVSKLGDKISILHYGGHAGSLHLELENAHYKLHQLVSLLGGKSGLKLVFLNGCSTKGLVKNLLDAGVRSVIATSEAIGDHKAFKFAVDFYSAFAIEQKTLETAFNEAAANAVAWTGKKLFKRGFDFGDDWETDNAPLSWGLYFREDSASILQWKLNEGPQAGGAVAPDDEDWSRLLSGYNEKLELISQLEKSVRSKKAIITVLQQAADENADLIKETEKEMQKAEADRRMAEEQRDLYFQQLKRLKTEGHKALMKERLVDAFHSLNYIEQIKTFRSDIKLGSDHETPFGAFIIQGSPCCGQEILRNRLITLAGIPSNCKQVLIDFSTAGERPTADNIWKQIRTAFGSVNAEHPEDIIREVYDQYYSKLTDLVIFFNNIQAHKISENRKIIETFWLQFVKGMAKLASSARIRNKILLFAIDKQCVEIDTEQGPALLRSYEAEFEGLPVQDSHTFILPLIPKVKPNQLDEWEINQNLAFHLNYKDFLPEEGRYILPTIKEICTRTDFEHLYYEHFPDYPEGENQYEL